MSHRIQVSPQFVDTRSQVQKQKLERLGFAGKIKNLLVVDVYTVDKDFEDKHIEQIASSLTNPVTHIYSVIPDSDRGSLATGDSRLRGNDTIPFAFAIETGFLPGVTDNVATTTKQMIEDLFKTSFSVDEGVYTSQLIYINGTLSEKEIRQVADTLINPLIQRVHIKSAKEYHQDQGMGMIIPKVKLETQTDVTEVNLNVSDEELIEIGKKGILNVDGTRRGPLALDLLSMKTIQTYFKKAKRNPTDVELESIAQTWSEHCKHTIFANPLDDVKKGLYKTYIKGATEKLKNQNPHIKKNCVSVFTDNSGAIIFDKDYLVTHKVETHNSPSALDPFGGAITGIVGVNRDALGFGLGAKPIVNTYGFCLANPDDKIPLYKDKNLTQKMLSPRRIMDGVIAGINSGGNQSGIPSPQGFLYYDDRYKGKPLVFAGTVGLIPRYLKSEIRNGKSETNSKIQNSNEKKVSNFLSNFDIRTSNLRPSHIKQAKPGDHIVIIGGRVGKDGIHGATFSSEALDSGSPATAVQIGDPITQKKLSDAVVKEARDLGLYTSITDNGAGGISCSVAEMAKECGGCYVELEKVPVKYPGLAPWEIWISESQERMTLAVPKKKWKQFSHLMKRRGVEATVIGEFNDSGKCVVTHVANVIRERGRNALSSQRQKTHNSPATVSRSVIMNLDMKFLHDGLPKQQLKSKKFSIKLTEPIFAQPKDLSKTLLNMLSQLNIAGYEFVSQQYDHTVQSGAVLGPLQGKGRINADATVTRPVLTSQKGVILSQSLYPRYSDIDTYGMAAAAIDTAIRNIVCAGGDPKNIVLLDNFCWCSSTEPERLYQLKKAAEACYDYAIAFKAPYISGKDSMFNDFKGFDAKGNPLKISIPPTLLISSISVVNDVTKTVSLDAKFAGDLVYVLGETYDELGGSEYFAMQKEIGKKLPEVNAKKSKKLYEALYQSTQKGYVASAQSVGRGGLAVALAKTAMGGMLGMEIFLKKLPGKTKRDDYALFSESMGRIVVTIAPKNQKVFEKLMKGNAYAAIGVVTDSPKMIIKGKKEIINIDINKALQSYKERFKDY